MRYSHFLILSLIAIFSHAQEPVKPVFESVFYQNNGKVYVNKTLPIYISISSSSDGSNPIVLDTPSNPSDGSPMYFDTEGANFIRSKWAVDPETKKVTTPKREVLFPINADGIAPVSEIKLHSFPTRRSSDHRKSVV